jgi:YVTN family beta-propeller protein
MDMGHDTVDNPTTIPIPAITFDALFVVNGGGNSISVINTSTNEVAGTIPLKDAEFPHHLYLSPDRASLSLAVPGMDLSSGHGGGHGSMAMKGAILKLNALTGATEISRVFEASNHNGAFSPDGKEIWTSQMTMPGKILVLEALTLKTLKTIEVGDMPAEVTFSRDGKYAFSANGMADNVTVIDAAAKSIVKTIPVGSNPVGAWPGPDSLLFVDNEEGKSITVINASKPDTVLTFPLGFTPGMAAVAPSGELWVTDSDNGKVAFFSIGTGAKLGETATGAGAHGIAFSGDGTAYVSNQGAASVSVLNVATKAVTKSITVGVEPNGMVFRKMP